MVSFVPENVAAEKVDAMSKFQRRRNFWKFVPAIEVVAAVLVILSWFTPSLLAGEYLRRIISGGFGNGIIIFGVVNVLIALIFSLSNNQKLNENDLYFQYVSSSAVAAPISVCSSSAVVSESSTSENEEKTLEEKTGTTDLTSVTLVAEEARTVKREMVRAMSSVTETAHAIRRKHEMTSLPSSTTEIESTKDHQVYRRSGSERLHMRREFRRSMTRFCEMDDLSNDEFRSKVETFIAGKKKMLSKEWLKP